MKQVWITRHGLPEVLQVKEAEDPFPARGMVRIRVKASGVNFADVMARLGIYPDAPPVPAVVGYEVAGVIDKTGDGVDPGMEGMNVFGLTRFGGYSDTVCVPWDQVFPMPAGMSYEEAAAVPVNYITAYQILVVMGSIKRGERVLIHNAGGGVGLAAIDICTLFDTEIIGTASSRKHSLLSERGVAHLIDYRREDFSRAVIEYTGGRGVHIVMDPIGGKTTKKGFRILAPSGRLIMFGISSAAGGKKRSLFRLVKTMIDTPWFAFHPVKLMNSNRGVLGVNVGHMWSEREMVEGWVNQLLEWYQAGHIRPRVDRVFSFEEAADAHHYLQDRRNTGKVVLVPSQVV